MHDCRVHGVGAERLREYGTASVLDRACRCLQCPERQIYVRFGGAVVNALGEGSISISCSGSLIDPALSEERAHESSITGVTTDGLNRCVITTDSAGVLRFWNLNTRTLRNSVQLEAGWLL